MQPMMVTSPHFRRLESRIPNMTQLKEFVNVLAVTYQMLGYLSQDSALS